MNRKQFILLLALVAAIGTIGLIIHQRGSTSWRSGGQGIGQKLLPNLPVNDIAQITIKSSAGELNLARSGSLWRVRERGDYPANFASISELLMKFADLKVAQAEEIGPSQFGRFELLAPGNGTNTGTLIEFKDAAGKVRSSVLLGKKHLRKGGGGSAFGGMGGDEGWADGRYVKASDASTVALISDPLDSVQAGAAGWLDKDFFHIENPRSLAVQFPVATNSWKLTRASETNDWQLADAKAGEKLDETKIAGATSAFSSPSFNDVAKSGAAGTNDVVATIETFDGFTYVATLGDAAGGDHSLTLSVTASLPGERVAGKDEKPEDKARLDQEFKERQAKLNEKLAKEKQFAGWTYAVPGYVCESLLQPRSQLLVEISTNQAPATANK